MYLYLQVCVFGLNELMTEHCVGKISRPNWNAFFVCLFSASVFPTDRFFKISPLINLQDDGLQMLASFLSHMVKDSMETQLNGASHSTG